MNKKRKSNSKGIPFGIVLAVLFVSLFVINRWIGQQIQDLDETPVTNEESVNTVVSAETAVSKKKIVGDVVRKSKLDPSRKFSNSRIYANDEIIARYKSANNKMYDLEGDIPNGKVSFVDESAETYGVEYYRNNKLHGKYEEYYSNDQIKRKAEFIKGELMRSTDYFIDGVTRMKQDFSDALRFVDNKEVGVGQVFRRNGSMLYEWNLTNEKQGGFSKSYNKDGKMIQIRYYDNAGKETKVLNF